MKLTNKINNILERDKKNKDNPCWKGYERVPNTKEGEKGSCIKINNLKESKYYSSKSKISMSENKKLKQMSLDIRSVNTREDAKNLADLIDKEAKSGSISFGDASKLLRSLDIRLERLGLD